MNQEKRSLIAAVLSFAVLLTWFYFFKPNKPEAQRATQAPAVNASAPVNPEKAQEPPTVSQSVTTQQESSAVPAQTVAKEDSLVKMLWTNQGATFSKLELKNFKSRTEKDQPVNLLSFEGEKALPLLCENCNQALPADGQYKLAAETENTVAFEAQNHGLKVTKIYQWNPEQYLFNVKVLFENQGTQEFRGHVGLGWTARQFPATTNSGLLKIFKARSQDVRTLLYKADNKVLHDVKVGETREIKGSIPWAGIEDRYFLISLISRQISNEQLLRLEHTQEWLKVSFFPSEMAVAPQGKQEFQYSFYMGPKQRTSLETAGVGLEEAVDYGWFGIIAVPILKLLLFFHKWVGNWGLAVIVLTLFIKILTNPLSIKSMKQMKAMQSLQPQLQALKEKYKDDRQRLNMETMALFKKNQVNPMGGCLPMVMQMPIYIALYKVLYNAIELYQAPFFAFYKDLSMPDPYFILPVILGVAMVLQQKLTPNPSADPTQKQMMMIMPIMFTGFMLFLPVGLVLYILINTGMSVLQQWMYQRDIRWRDLISSRKA